MTQPELTLTSRALRRARRIVARYRRDDDGATAIEFGVVALAFFTIVFGILELAMIFFTQSVLSHAVSDAGRSIRVGHFQNCGQEDEFRALVCDGMQGLFNCGQNLRVDVISRPQFRDVVMPALNDGGTSDPSNPQPVQNGTYDANAAGSPVAIRATFYYPLVLPPQITRLESRNAAGGVISPGRKLIVASTAFRNEPFPTSATCNPDVQSAISGT